MLSHLVILSESESATVLSHLVILIRLVFFPSHRPSLVVTPIRIGIAEGKSSGTGTGSQNVNTSSPPSPTLSFIENSQMQSCSSPPPMVTMTKTSKGSTIRLNKRKYTKKGKTDDACKNHKLDGIYWRDPSTTGTGKHERAHARD